MSSEEPSCWSRDDCLEQMMSLPCPVDNALAQTSVPVLMPVRQDVYGVEEDRRQQVVVVLALPRCTVDERRARSMSECGVDMTLSTSRSLSPALIAQDLTLTRRCDSELPTKLAARDEGLSDGDCVADKTPELSPVAASGPPLSTRNPVFGNSKSPKSYWLRRHSDSVFAHRGVEQQNDGPVEQLLRIGKERTASDSRSNVEVSDSKMAVLPLRDRFQSTVVELHSSGDVDEVFDDEAPAVESTRLGVSPDPALDPQQTGDPAATYGKFEETLPRRRSRLSVISAGDLDDIDEESRSPVLEARADEADPLMVKMELCEPASDDGVANGQREIVRPESARRRGLIHCRGSSVARSTTDDEFSSGVDAASGGSKLHRCTVCRRTFTRSDMLERHARLHTGVRPYACRLCTQVFSRSDHLTTHLRTHTGEKPYACPRCAYTASRRDMVTRHLRVHQSTASVDPATEATGIVGPPRRRIYRSRYKDRPGSTGVNGVRTGCSPEARSALLDNRSGYVPAGVDGRRLDEPSVSWMTTEPLELPAPSPPTSEIVRRRRLDHVEALHALSRSVVARGSTGSTDSYSSPGCLSATDMFEFSVGASPSVDSSPDVFRSPSSARQSSVFLFPYPAPTSGLAVGEQSDAY